MDRICLCSTTPARLPLDSAITPQRASVREEVFAFADSCSFMGLRWCTKDCHAEFV